MSARNMSSAVVDRLMGYAIMMVRRSGFWGNAVKIHSGRTPHTPDDGEHRRYHGYAEALQVAGEILIQHGKRMPRRSAAVWYSQSR